MSHPNRAAVLSSLALVSLITLIAILPAAAGRPDRDAGVIETSRIAPLYPLGAADAGYDASVLVAVLVGEDGTVRDTQVREATRLNLGFEEAAIDAIRQWRFRPARREGRSVESVSWHRLTFRTVNDSFAALRFSAGNGRQGASLSLFSEIIGPGPGEPLNRSPISRVHHDWAPPFPGKPGVLYDARSKPRYAARQAAAASGQ